MTTADELNMAAVLLTVLGSMMSTFGVLLQMNGYIPSRMVRLISLFWYMFRAALKRGLSGAREYFRGIDILAGEQREDRAVSVFGLILILLGFALQTIGAAVSIRALLRYPSQKIPQCSPCMPCTQPVEPCTSERD